MAMVSATAEHRMPGTWQPNAEGWVVGSMLMRPACIPEVIQIVRARDFVDEAARAVYASILRMHQAGQPIDVGLVRIELERSGAVSGDASVEFLTRIATEIPTSAHAEHYAGIVAEVSRKRRLADYCRHGIDSAENGHTSREIVNSLLSDIDDLRREVDPNEREIESHTLVEFNKLDFPQAFLVENMIPAAQGGVLFARSKTQKTTISVDAVVSLGAGRSCLGKYYVPEPLPCGIISAESGGATLQESFRRIVNSKLVDINTLRNVHVSTKLPMLVDQRGRDQIERFIDRHDLRCLFVDPTYLAFAGVDDSNLASMAEVLFPISEIIDRTGCSIVFVHHARKTPRMQGRYYDEPTMDDIVGTGWQQWARFFVMLNRRREWNPDTGQHWLWLRTEGSAGFGSRYWLNVREGRRCDPEGRVWQVDLQKPEDGEAAERESQDGMKQSEQLRHDREAVRDALADNFDGLTRSRARELSGVYRQRWENAVEAMLDDGEIETCDVFVSNQKTPRQGYRLAVNLDPKDYPG